MGHHHPGIGHGGRVDLHADAVVLTPPGAQRRNSCYAAGEVSEPIMNMLAVRWRQEEQMDAADINPRVYAAVLADLARVNRWTFTAHPTLNYLDRAAGKLKSFALLDGGFGHGDMLRA